MMFSFSILYILLEKDIIKTFGRLKYLLYITFKKETKKNDGKTKGYYYS